MVLSSTCGLSLQPAVENRKPVNHIFHTGRKGRVHLVKFFPTGRKKGKIPLDKTPIYSLKLEARVWRGVGQPHRLAQRILMNAETNAENAGQIIRRKGNAIVRGMGKKSHGGTAGTQKMLEMKVDPEMYMKTKDRVTNCPTQKTTFLPGCRSFYTKIQEFCRN